ncbi:unnamed protein product, partial [Callosobruchus maculatus]
VKLSDSELYLGAHKSSSQQYTNETKEYPQQQYIPGAQLCAGGQPHTSSLQQYTPTTPQPKQTPEQYYAPPNQNNYTISQQYTSPKPHHHASLANIQQNTPNTSSQYGAPTHDMYPLTTPKQYISPTPQRYASTSQNCLTEAQNLSHGTKASSPESLHVGTQGTTIDQQEHELQLRPQRSPRTVLLKDQIALMEAVYDVNQRPSREVKDRLVNATGLPMKVIKIWFQNRRQKTRKEKQEAEAVTNS